MPRVGSEVRQQQIVEAAMEIISTEGMQNLTMVRIAERVGITDAALYRHFASKKDILSAMIDNIGRTLTERIHREVIAYDDPFEKLRRVLEVHLSYLEQHRGVPRLLIAEVVHANDDDLRRRMVQMVNHYLDFIRGILFRGVQTGRFRRDLDIDAAAIAFLGLAQTTAILWSLNNFSFSITEKTEGLWRVYAESLEARQ